MNGVNDLLARAYLSELIVSSWALIIMKEWTTFIGYKVEIVELELNVDNLKKLVDEKKIFAVDKKKNLIYALM